MLATVAFLVSNGAAAQDRSAVDSAADDASRLSFEICEDEFSFSIRTTQALFRIEVANVDALRSVQLVVAHACGETHASLMGFVSGELRFQGRVELSELEVRTRPRAVVLSLVELLALHAPAPAATEGRAAPRDEPSIERVEPDVDGPDPVSFGIALGARWYSNQGTPFYGGELMTVWQRFELRLGVRGGRVNETAGQIGYLMATLSVGLTLYSSRFTRPLTRFGFALRALAEVGLGWARGVPDGGGTTGLRTFQPVGAGYAEALVDVRLGRRFLGLFARAGGGGGLLATIDDERTLAAQGVLLEAGLVLSL